MSTFHDRIREALSKPAREDLVEKLPAEFEKVLVDFARGLQAARPSLDVVIEPNGRVYELAVHPKYRRDEGHTALRLRWNGTVLRIGMGEKSDFDEVRSPDELREYLLRALGDAEFREAIDEYGESEEQIPALLYEDDADLLAGRVVLVAVQHGDQSCVAKAKPGERLVIRATPREGRSRLTKSYSARQAYAWLRSGGYELRVLEHRPEGDEIVLVVEKEAEG